MGAVSGLTPTLRTALGATSRRTLLTSSSKTGKSSGGFHEAKEFAME